MGRITRVFERLDKAHERALIPYVTAGDPDAETTKALIHELARRGGDLIEIGVPFSDPLADGPIIQRASQRALQCGMTLRTILHMVRDLRRAIDTPLILMTYYNPVYRYGEEAFVADALEAGVDGLIVPDLPPEEAQTLIDLTAQTALDMVFLAAPTSTSARLAMISEVSQGFIYYISRLGTTGLRDRLADDLRDRLEQLRAATAKPIAVGIGVSNPEQAKAVATMADGVVVGSAIVKLIEDLQGSAELVSRVGDFVAALKAATRIASVAPEMPAS